MRLRDSRSVARGGTRSRALVLEHDSVSETLASQAFLAIRFLSISEHVENAGDTSETRVELISRAETLMFVTFERQLEFRTGPTRRNG